MVICLERDADLHMAQLMPLPLTVYRFSKIQICLPFWYRLTWVVPDKGPLNACSSLYTGQSLVHLVPCCMLPDCCILYTLQLYYELLGESTQLN